MDLKVSLTRPLATELAASSGDPPTASVEIFRCCVVAMPRLYGCDRPSEGMFKALAQSPLESIRRFGLGAPSDELALAMRTAWCSRSSCPHDKMEDQRDHCE